MVGKQSLWRVWRAQLPSPWQLRSAAMNRLKVWAGFLDPDFLHAQRVAQLALRLYDGLKQAGLLAPNPEHDSRAVLQVAALLHDVGKAKSDGGHHKDSFRMIRGLERPLGWSAREMELAAVVARYHRGAFPAHRRKTLQRLGLPDRRTAVQLAGVLRLANALDMRNGAQPRLEVGVEDHIVLVRAAGYSVTDRAAENVAAARHLLETVLRRPVLVRGLRVANGEKRVGNG
jgi:exopolyphosphatase/pppGpp-phosphohydrolase